ncbi:hypothetical protein F5X96DRAFT_648516 [Biscogniauxia mediterranea]|nr:hypothetical protein F5X96DRAFT_648516 [Biscogniauxia mediterranea]
MRQPRTTRLLGVSSVVIAWATAIGNRESVLGWRGFPGGDGNANPRVGLGGFLTYILYYVRIDLSCYYTTYYAQVVYYVVSNVGCIPVYLWLAVYH